MENRQNDFALYRRLLLQARAFWPHIVGLFSLSLLSTPLALLAPLPLKIVVDNVIGSHPAPSYLTPFLPAQPSTTAILILAAVLVVFVALMLHLQGLGQWLLQTYVGEKLVLDFRSRLFRHVQRLSLSYHDTRGTSDSIYRIQTDAPAIQSIAISGLIPFITSAFTLIGMIYVIALLDWQLALIALVVSPAIYLLTRSCRRRLRNKWTEVKEVEATAMSVVHEVLSALRVVKAFSAEDQEEQRFVRHSSEGLRGHLRLAFIESSFDFLIGLTIALGTAATLVVGVLHVERGALTLGGLLIAMTYLAQLYAPLETISKKVTQLQASLASAERTFALLDELPDVSERPNAQPLVRACGDIHFRQASFAYNDGGTLLKDISFEVKAGARVGLSGHTGAGKTTLINLLTRFYDPTAGQITLDGVDLRDYRLTDLRQQFAIVLQESVLFSTSISENISYARPEASHEEIVAAAKAADAHDFIMRLPQGYDTQVGERGLRLSGGERQRISLARAFLKDAPILILDEPTSSVDMETEAAIMEALKRLMQNRTTFIIAHRLSTLESCDLRLHLERGRLVRAETVSPTPFVKAATATASLLQVS